MLRIILHSLAFVVLTIFTQVGGIIYLLCLFFHPWINRSVQRRWPRRGVKLLSFIIIYLLVSLLIVPPLAKSFGRTPLPMNEGNVKPANLLTVLLNRHYVRPQLKKTLFSSAQKLNAAYPGSYIVYLDANFPFINGFPLIFHLSHNDGKKADLAFCYKEKNGAQTNDVPTFSGYGGFEAPLPGEENMPEVCKEKGYWQYSLAKNFSLSGKDDNLQLDKARTEKLLRILCADPNTEKIFLEPHLKKRMGLTENKIRFHGCHAARHDDHIHLQIQ